MWEIAYFGWMLRWIRPYLPLLAVMLSTPLPAQWTNLGKQSFPLRMTSDYRGIRVTNHDGPTPSNGTVWTVSTTDDDWVSTFPRSSGGGGSMGCCTVELLDMLNDSMGFGTVSNLGLRSVMATRDGGTNWQSIASGALTSMVPISHLQAYSDTVAYLMGRGSSPFSALGLRFTPSGFDTIFSSPILEGENGQLHFVNDSVGFVIAHDSNDVYRLFRTTNGGTTWSMRLAVGIGELRVIDFVDDQVGFVAGGSGVCYQTTDGGFSWNSLAVNGPVDVRAIDFLTAQVGYLACGGGVVLRTTDGGVSWATDIIDSSLTLVYVKAVNGTMAYAMSSDSVLYKRNYIAGTDDLWVNASMASAFPNPTSGKITLQLPEQDHLVNWACCDLNGRKLAEGTSLDLDIGTFPSGTYVLRLQTRKGLQWLRLVKN